MKSNSRGLLMKPLTETDLEQAIEDAHKADGARLGRRLCFVKDLLCQYAHGIRRSRRNLQINDGSVG